MSWQTAASVASGVGSLASGFGLGQKSPKVDYEGAKKGIRWRVEDARKAGIHPLYAIGAPGVGSGILQPEKSTDPGAGIAGAAQAYHKFSDRRQRQEVQAQTVDQMAARTELLNKEKEWIQEQIDASKARRVSQASLTHGDVNIGQNEIVPYEIMTDKGPMMNPDVAIGAEEVIGSNISRFLHSRPKDWDLKEFFLGPWLRAFDINPTGPKKYNAM